MNFSHRSERIAYSGGDPRRLNVLKMISTRWPGPAKNMYKHCREWFDILLITGDENVPFCGPPGRDTNVWSHSVGGRETKKSEKKFLWFIIHRKNSCSLANIWRDREFIEISQTNLPCTDNSVYHFYMFRRYFFHANYSIVYTIEIYEIHTYNKFVVYVYPPPPPIPIVLVVIPTQNNNDTKPKKPNSEWKLHHSYVM